MAALLTLLIYSNNRGIVCSCIVGASNSIYLFVQIKKKKYYPALIVTHNLRGGGDNTPVHWAGNTALTHLLSEQAALNHCSTISVSESEEFLWQNLRKKFWFWFQRFNKIWSNQNFKTSWWVGDDIIWIELRLFILIINWCVKTEVSSSCSPLVQWEVRVLLFISWLSEFCFTHLEKCERVVVNGGNKDETELRVSFLSVVWL